VGAALRPVDARGVERLPPHSVEAEQSVLGGLLLDNTRWPVATSMLKVEAFYSQEHALIFSAIGELVCAGRTADVITVYEFLQCRNVSEVVGGMKYLNALAQSVPGAANLHRYAEIVLNHAAMRGVIDLSNAASSEAFHARGKSAAQVIAEVIVKFSALGVAARAHEHSTGIDAAELLTLDLPDPAYVCDPFLPEGLTLVSGRAVSAG
jgi:replicative DNA helicase